jgi:hypothetical protein
VSDGLDGGVDSGIDGGPNDDGGGLAGEMVSGLNDVVGGHLEMMVVVEGIVHWLHSFRRRDKWR